MEQMQMVSPDFLGHQPGAGHSLDATRHMLCYHSYYHCISKTGLKNKRGMHVNTITLFLFWNFSFAYIALQQQNFTQTVSIWFLV